MSLANLDIHSSKVLRGLVLSAKKETNIAGWKMDPDGGCVSHSIQNGELAMLGYQRVYLSAYVYGKM